MLQGGCTAVRCVRRRREEGRTEKRIEGERESGAFAREGKEESGRRIRYLSRRCCVQVNKLTRRRASAIFFPINLNLLLTLFPCSLACPFPRSPFSGSPASTLPPLRACYPSFLRYTIPFSRPLVFRSLRASLSLVSTCSRSVVFLLNLSRRFSVPFVLSFFYMQSPGRVSAASAGVKRPRRRWHRASRFTAR